MKIFFRARDVCGTYLSVASGKVTRLNSQVMIGGGTALILQVKRATEPSVTTMEEGCWVNVEIPEGDERNTYYRIRRLIIKQISENGESAL